MRDKEGFTLIELLAVIVLLAVIALISTPIIISLMDNAKREAFKNSAYGIIEAANLYYANSLLEPSILAATKTFDFPNATGLELRGSKPESGQLRLYTDGTTELAIVSDKLCAIKNRNESTITIHKELANCTLGAQIVYTETLLNGADPEVGTGLIPVKIETNGTVKKADTSTKWYEYGKKQWANAVTVTEATRTKYMNAEAGAAIAEKDILTYLVWIPRYRYQLWNAENGNSEPQEIQIVFEDRTTTKATGNTNESWLTHPAFTFEFEELNGFWVGKFETGFRQSDDMSDTSAWTTTGAQQLTADASKVIIKPNVYSWRNITVGNMFKTTMEMKDNPALFGLSTASDTHMMKNMEWGAVAYLSHSRYGVNGEVWINNCDIYLTGIAGDTVSADSSSTTCTTAANKWNGAMGVKASTTGNITGVYDMSGGSWEYVMGNTVNESGDFQSSAGGFSNSPTRKYYDSYTYGITAGDATAHARGLIGDTTRETLKTFGGGTEVSWYGDNSSFPNSTNSWFLRGGYHALTNVSGVFAFSGNDGIASPEGSWRIVIQSR